MRFLGDRFMLGHAARLLALLAALLAPAIPAAAQAPVQIKAVAENDEVYLGKSFFFQIQVLGGSRVMQPDLSVLRDFDVRELSASWVAGRWPGRLQKFDLQNGTSYLYRLIALRPGRISIPSLPIEVDGGTYTSPSVALDVLNPPPSRDFKLSLLVSKTRLYVGEPVILKAVWYARKSARFYLANIPILRDASFNPDSASAGSPLFSRTFAAGPGSTGKEGTAVVDGVLYSTVSFERVLVPRSAGTFAFPPATVQVWGAGEKDNTQSYGKGWNLDSTVVGSMPLTVNVLPLPAAGRPANFSGLVAEKVHVEAGLAPSEMNVGDPVTLTLTLSGPPSVSDIRLPLLGTLAPLTGSFSFRDEPMAEKSDDTSKSFSQTIRVTSPAVREIPPFEIPYFDPAAGQYKVARSRPVSITVRPTKVLTASDLEGVDAPRQSRQVTGVRSWQQGILSNDAASASLLEEQSPGIGSLVRDPVVSIAIGLPLLGFLSALLTVLLRRARERGSRIEQAAEDVSPYAQLARRLEDMKENGAADEALVAWREYLVSRLGLEPGKQTPREIESELGQRGIEKEMLAQVEELFGRYERGSYGRGAEQAGEEDQSLVSRIARVSAELDARLS